MSTKKCSKSVSTNKVCAVGVSPPAPLFYRRAPFADRGKLAGIPQMMQSVKTGQANKHPLEACI